MDLGLVTGSIVCTQKDPSLVGSLLLVLQPISHLGKNNGEPLIVADPDCNAGRGDVVVYVHSPDASMAFPGDLFAPIDAAVVAIIDHVDIGKTATIQAGETWKLEK
jgi:microcompartment protein CcmK/EutM